MTRRRRPGLRPSMASQRSTPQGSVLSLSRGPSRGPVGERACAGDDRRERRRRMSMMGDGELDMFDGEGMNDGTADEASGDAGLTEGALALQVAPNTSAN